jgi:hypothetical protein
MSWWRQLFRQAEWVWNLTAPLVPTHLTSMYEEKMHGLKVALAAAFTGTLMACNDVASSHAPGH